MRNQPSAAVNLNVAPLPPILDSKKNRTEFLKSLRRKRYAIDSSTLKKFNKTRKTNKTPSSGGRKGRRKSRRGKGK